MNEKAKRLLTVIYEGHVEEVLDDVAQFFANIDEDARELDDSVGHVLQINISEFIDAAAELGLDFWKTAKESGTDAEIMMFEDGLAARGMAWGWRPEAPKPKIEPEVRDDSIQKLWCYRLTGDKETHYGPIAADSVALLLQKLSTHYRPERLDGVEFWLTDNKAYLKPPAAGSGQTIYGFDREHGWRPVRSA